MEKRLNFHGRMILLVMWLAMVGVLIFALRFIWQSTGDDSMAGVASLINFMGLVAISYNSIKQGYATGRDAVLLAFLPIVGMLIYYAILYIYVSLFLPDQWTLGAVAISGVAYFWPLLLGIIFNQAVLEG